MRVTIGIALMAVSVIPLSSLRAQRPELPPDTAERDSTSADARITCPMPVVFLRRFSRLNMPTVRVDGAPWMPVDTTTCHNPRFRPDSAGVSPSVVADRLRFLVLPVADDTSTNTFPAGRLAAHLQAELEQRWSAARDAIAPATVIAALHSRGLPADTVLTVEQSRDLARFLSASTLVTTEALRDFSRPVAVLLHNFTGEGAPITSIAVDCTQVTPVQCAMRVADRLPDPH